MRSRLSAALLVCLGSTLFACAIEDDVSDDDQIIDEAHADAACLVRQGTYRVTRTVSSKTGNSCGSVPSPQTQTVSGTKFNAFAIVPAGTDVSFTRNQCGMTTTVTNGSARNRETLYFNRAGTRATGSGTTTKPDCTIRYSLSVTKQ